MCHLNAHGMTPANTGGECGLNAALRSSLCGPLFTSVCDVHTNLFVFTNTHDPRYDVGFLQALQSTASCSPTNGTLPSVLHPALEQLNAARSCTLTYGMVVTTCIMSEYVVCRTPPFVNSNMIAKLVVCCALSEYIYIYSSSCECECECNTCCQ
jgi:hypothetical protein